MKKILGTTLVIMCMLFVSIALTGCRGDGEIERIPLGVPTGLVLNSAGTHLSWDAVTGAGLYDIFRDDVWAAYTHETTFDLRQFGTGDWEISVRAVPSNTRHFSNSDVSVSIKVSISNPL